MTSAPEHRVTIRIAAQRDTVAIAPLLGQLGYPTHADELGGRLERLTEHPDVHVLIAELDGRIVGVAVYQLIGLLERRDPQCRITTLVVDHRYRRRGVAYALIHTIEESALEHGCFRLEVTTQADRDDALAFYRAAGFDERPRRLTKDLPERASPADL